MKHCYFIVYSDHIVCAIISRKKHNVSQLYLQSVAKIDGDTNSALPLLQKKITEFITRYSLEGCYAHIAFMHPIIYENCIIMNKAMPTDEDFSHEHKVPGLLYKFTYLYPLYDGKHQFYLCGVAPQTVFFFTLLLNSCGLYTAQMTSSYIAFLHVYKKLYQHAFRQSQLAADLEKTYYNILHLFTNDIISRLLFIPAHLAISIDQNKEFLATLIGLAHIQESTYEY